MCVWQYSQYIAWHMYIIATCMNMMAFMTWNIYNNLSYKHTQIQTMCTKNKSTKAEHYKLTHTHTHTHTRTHARTRTHTHTHAHTHTLHAYLLVRAHIQITTIYSYRSNEHVASYPIHIRRVHIEALKWFHPLWQSFQNWQWKVKHLKVTQICHCSHAGAKCTSNIIRERSLPYSEWGCHHHTTSTTIHVSIACTLHSKHM